MLQCDIIKVLESAILTSTHIQHIWIHSAHSKLKKSMIQKYPGTSGQGSSLSVMRYLVGRQFIHLCTQNAYNLIKMDRSKEEFVQWLEEMLEELVEGVSTPLEVCVVRVFICPCV